MDLVRAATPDLVSEQMARWRVDQSVPADPVCEKSEAAEDRMGASRGVNIAPGCDDDGWVVPPPVELCDGTRLQLHKDGEALHAGFEAIRAAKSRVCLEFYIWADDVTGNAFADLLCDKARQGIRVYVLYDSFGSRGLFGREPELFARMRAAGVRVEQFHPVRPWECLYSWRPVCRDHRKLLLVDNDVAGLGGLNVGAEYAGSWVTPYAPETMKEVGREVAESPPPGKGRRFRKWLKRRAMGPKAHADPLRIGSSPAPSGGSGSAAARDKSGYPAPGDLWRDNAMGIRGPGALKFMSAFAHAWNYTIHGGRMGKTQYWSDLCDGELGVLASSPTINSPLRPTLIRLMREARESIELTMAYFAPDDDLVNTLCRRAKRGVNVRLMLPGLSDVPMVRRAAQSYYERLMSCGVEIYERQGVVLHAKTLVVDRNVSVIGSANLDYRSIEYNLELSAIVRNATFGQQVHDLFENDVRYAKRILPEEWRRRPTRDRCIQWAVSRARYLL